VANRPEKSPLFPEHSSSGSTSVIMILMIALVLSGVYVLATNAIKNDPPKAAQAESSKG
jgi:hypothetical protein